MLKNIVAFHTLASSAVEKTAAGGSEGQKITFNVIKQRLGDLMYKITSQKFEDPVEGEEAIRSGYPPPLHSGFGVFYRHCLQQSVDYP